MGHLELLLSNFRVLNLKPAQIESPAGESNQRPKKNAILSRFW